MGGPGSTRWLYHIKKVQVEDCLRLSIFGMGKHIYSGSSGYINWSIGEEETNSISFRVLGQNIPTSMELSYRLKSGPGDGKALRYPVILTTTPLPWGGERYWFQCPLTRCGRRVGILYLPPGEKFFGCRHCYNLTYRSSQDQHEFDGVFAMLAASMTGEYPGITPEHLKRIMTEDRSFRHLNTEKPKRYKYLDYLTRKKLMKQAGISEDTLKRLEEKKLLLPDHKDLYRSKLVSWAKRLNYLLKAGWELKDIQAWSKGRWSSPNPRKWPPDREDWIQNRFD